MRISDWSSYVCSSDVLTAIFTVGLDDDWVKAEHVRATAERFGLSGADVSESIQALKEHGIDADEIALLRDSLIACFELNPPMSPRGPKHQPFVPLSKIRRASCRDRVCPYVSISVVAVYLKKKLIQTTIDKPTKNKKTKRRI